MKLSAGVEWALHCCVVLTATEAPVPVAKLAEFHDVSGSYLAKQLQALSRAGIIRSIQGHAGGYRLTRPAAEITVLDVVTAIDGDASTFVCTEIRQRGPMATPPEKCRSACPIARAMYRADHAWRQALTATTIADLASDVGKDSRPGTLPRVGAWLSGDETAGAVD